MVLAGNIGVSPLKRGPIGSFPKHIWNAVKSAFITYVKLEQARCAKQSSQKELSLKVNALVNASGFVKKKQGVEVVRRLIKETADEFEVNKRNPAEQRRVMWTTHSNLQLWFDTWKDTLIELGFARLLTEEEKKDRSIAGELFFLKGQRRRILNVDETDGSLDNTKGQRGGRPSTVLYAPEIAGGATQASKNSYSPTIICGANAKGEAVPPHFQLKSEAKTGDRQRIAIDVIMNCKSVNGQFGHPSTQILYCTYGMNEKAGMTTIELSKYMEKAIIPLYPDAQDVPGKRVIIKVDSGPGRTNVAMLAGLRVRGLYMIPSVPNTTHVTQEADQLYGGFKSLYRMNLETPDSRAIRIDSKGQHYDQ